MAVPFAIDGRQIAVAIDEEDHAHSAEEMERRRGRPHGCLWMFDITDLAKIQPLAIFEVSELDSPWSRAAPGRFGAHQFQEHMKDTLVYCAWFAGGLRIVDIADPTRAAGSRPLHSRTGRRARPRRRPTTSMSTTAGWCTSSTAMRGSIFWSSTGRAREPLIESSPRKRGSSKFPSDLVSRLRGNDNYCA